VTTANDDMSIREIARTIADFRSEFRSVVPQLLRSDVYRAEQVAMDLRIASLEKDRDAAEHRAESTRRIALTAGFGAIASLIGALLIAALT